MSAFHPTRLIVLLAVTFTSAGYGLASTSAKIVPARDEKMGFSRNYSNDHLKSHPLQMVKKTNFVLKNSKGLLTGTWTATIRDIRTDEAVEATTTAICKAHGSRKVNCTFDAITGSVILLAEPDGGLRVSIPVGQGVQFSREKDGHTWSEILLGADEDNREFKLNPQNSYLKSAPRKKVSSAMMTHAPSTAARRITSIQILNRL